MGKRNRERRAAKARQRERQRTAGAAAGRGWGGAESPPLPDVVSAALLAAAGEQLSGHPHVANHMAARLAERFAADPGPLEVGACSAVTTLLRRAWSGGWTPDDLHQLTRRQRDAAAVSYLVDAVADEARQYAAATVHERWHEQLRQLGAAVWWEPGRGHLGQWAQRHRRTTAEALTTVIDVLALLQSLPVLPRILPPPGTARATATGHRRGVDQKVLARVRGLLAKAESTTFPDEAEALSAKAQQLMSRHVLERIVVEAREESGPQPAGARRLWLDAPYVAAKALLVDAVAAANRCRCVLSEELGFATVLGDDVDLEIVELLTTSLLVQATRAMVSAGSRTSRTGQSRTRSYRQAFLVSYAIRIRERLTEARDAGSAGVADTGDLLPVLAARERVVDELYESLFPQSVHRSVRISNAEGWYAGRAAADLAVLQTRRAVGE